jgi:hypothetical protein
MSIKEEKHEESITSPFKINEDQYPTVNTEHNVQMISDVKHNQSFGLTPSNRTMQAFESLNVKNPYH